VQRFTAFKSWTAQEHWKDWNEDATVREADKKELLQSYEKAVKELRLATGIGAYVISDEAAKILTELESRPEHDNPYDAIDAALSDYQKALTKIRQLAKKDLKVR